MALIMVPLDGSAIAERALPFAQPLAQATGQPLLLVRVVPPEASADAPVLAASYLNDVAVRLGAGATVRTLVLTGSPADRLVSAVEEEGVATVVLTTHGRSALGRLLYGSVARAILLGCSVPLLMVRAWAAPLPSFAGPQSRVLVPLDGSPLAEAVLPAAAAIARQLGAELLLLRVVTPPERIASGTLGLLLAAAEPGLDRLVAEADRYLLTVRDAVQVSTPSLPIRTVVRIGQPSTEIRLLSAEGGVSFIAMATHGYTGLAWLALGSVAEDVLRHGTRPLLLVRPPHLGHGKAAVAATSQRGVASAFGKGGRRRPTAGARGGSWGGTEAAGAVVLVPAPLAESRAAAPGRFGAGPCVRVDIPVRTDVAICAATSVSMV